MSRVTPPLPALHAFAIFDRPPCVPGARFCAIGYEIADDGRLYPDPSPIWAETLGELHSKLPPGHASLGSLPRNRMGALEVRVG